MVVISQYTCRNKICVTDMKQKTD